MKTTKLVKFIILLISLVTILTISDHSDFALSQTSNKINQKMKETINIPLPIFAEGTAQVQTIDTTNPETIKIIEEGIKRAEYKLSVFKSYPYDSYPDPMEVNGLKMI